MTPTARASRRVLASAKLSSVEPVWISESLLAASIHRFTCTHNRHGSNVPGPLEARRRASKRRNTNLARLGPNPPIDPGVLFGAGPHQAWWQTSSPAASKAPVDTVPHFLPSWLAHSTPPPPLPKNWPASRSPISETEVESTSNSIPELFQDQLRLTSSLDEVRDVVTTLGLDLAKDAIFSELAFRHILATNYSLASDFLLDPTLNPPTATNYSRIVIYLKEKAAGKEERATLLQAVFRAFSLGLIRREEAQVIIQNLPGILIDSRTGPVAASNTSKISKYYSIILRCLTECNIFSTEDLGVDILNAWIGWVKQMPYDRYSADVILSLTKSVALSREIERPHPGSTAFQTFMFHVEITTTCDLTQRWLELLCQQPAQREPHLTQLAQFLSRRSASILRSVVLGIPERLVISIQNEKLSPEVLPMWEQVLRLFDKETITPILRKTAVWTTQTNTSDAGLRGDSRLLLKMWTAFIVCNRTKQSSRLKQMDFPSQLRDQFKEHRPAQLWTRILLTLQSLPKLHFKGQLFDFLNKVDQPLAAEDVIRSAKDQAALDAFASQGFAVLQDDKAYLHALQNLNKPLIELAELVNQDIARFAHIVLPLIARDQLSLRIVTRLLKHNQTLQLALKTAWSLPSETKTMVGNFGNPSASASRLTKVTTASRSTSDLHFNEAALKFMYDLGISFALSPALSDRQALRKVFWCYSFLHKFAAPIRPPMTKALWYAGVTRCEGRGTSRRVVLWLLNKIREVEGPATAEGLVTNRDFGAKRAREVWNWGRCLGQGRPWEEEEEEEEEEKAAASTGQPARVQGNVVTYDQTLVKDEDMLPRNGKSTDIDAMELMEDMWPSQGQHIQGSESRTEKGRCLRQAARKGSLVMRPWGGHAGDMPSRWQRGRSRNDAWTDPIFTE